MSRHEVLTDDKGNGAFSRLLRIAIWYRLASEPELSIIIRGKKADFLPRILDFGFLNAIVGLLVS